MLPSAFRAIPTPVDLRKARHGVAMPSARGFRTGSFFMGNAEPPLDEVMDDPIVRGLMARDGVALASLQSLISEVRGRLL